MDNNQRPNDSTGPASGSINIDHTMDLIKAAFPYLDSDSQQSMDFLIKAGEMMSTLRAMQNRNTVTTFSIRKQSIDLEGLLTSVRTVCYEKEREIVDMFLNLIQVKNMFSTYMTLSQTMSSQSDNFEDQSDNAGGSSNSDGSGGLGGMFGNANMMDMLGNLLSPEQKDTFESLSMLLNATNN
jgi:hypothetical protein